MSHFIDFSFTQVHLDWGKESRFDSAEGDGVSAFPPGHGRCARLRPECVESILLLRGYFPSNSLRGRIVGRYSSGQRGLTVNQVASPSQVRILACPPDPA